MPSLPRDELQKTDDQSLENNLEQKNPESVDPQPSQPTTESNQEIDPNQVKPKKNFSIGKAISLFLIVTSIFLLGFGAFFAYSLASTADQVIVSGDECNGIFDLKCLKIGNPLDTNQRTKLKGEDEGRTNLLVIGTDNAAGLADTIILVSYYHKEKKVVTVNIPRDTFVTTSYPNASGKSIRISEKINAVYPYASRARPDDEAAGPNALANLIATEFQIPVHYWAVANFTALQQIVEELGGIEVNVEKTFTDVFGKDQLPAGIKCPRSVVVEGGVYCEFTFQAGVNSLSGGMTLIFSRARKYSSDFDRSKRQSQVIQAIAKKAKEKGIFGNINNIRSYLKIFSNNVKVSVQLDEMLSFYKLTEDVNVDDAFYRAIWSNGNGFLCDGALSAGRGYHITYCGGQFIGGPGNSAAKQKAVKFIQNLLFEAQSGELYRSQVAIIGNKSPEAAKIRTELQNIGFDNFTSNNAHKPIVAATTKSKQKITLYIPDEKIRELFNNLSTKPTFEYTIENTLPPEKVPPDNVKNYPIIIWVESI